MVRTVSTVIVGVGEPHAHPLQEALRVGDIFDTQLGRKHSALCVRKGVSSGEAAEL